MSRRKQTDEPLPEAPGESPPGDATGDGEKRSPVFKAGPIATDRNNAVSVAVWANEVTSNGDGRTFTVYNVTCESRWRDSDGSWKSGKQFRSSQLPTLIYCLQRCFEWVCAQRDPQKQDSPF